MKVYALSDLHLSFMVNKPMDVFGEHWDNYEERVKENVNNILTSDDILLIAGDISWAMNMPETQKDFEYIASLNGKKIIIRGNHDYWWKSITRIREVLPQNVYALQNDAIKIGSYVICGTRGWVVPERGKTLGAEDQKIFDRELIRLELALIDARAKAEPGDEIICMLHYPPFNSELEESQFTNLIDRYSASKVVYGHLHGYTKISPTEPVEINGVKYYLTSCDKLRCVPKEI